MEFTKTQQQHIKELVPLLQEEGHDSFNQLLKDVLLENTAIVYRRNDYNDVYFLYRNSAVDDIVAKDYKKKIDSLIESIRLLEDKMYILVRRKVVEENGYHDFEILDCKRELKCEGKLGARGNDGQCYLVNKDNGGKEEISMSGKEWEITNGDGSKEEYKCLTLEDSCADLYDSKIILKEEVIELIANNFETYNERVLAVAKQANRIAMFSIIGTLVITTVVNFYIACKIPVKIDSYQPQTRDSILVEQNAKIDALMQTIDSFHGDSILCK